MQSSPEQLDLIFNGANLFVLPFWGLMVLLPNWFVTRRVMDSYLPYVALAGLYVYLFVTLDQSVLEAFADPELSLASLAGMFANSQVMATGWVHFVVMDLFVGRWIYWQGQTEGIFTRHSLALCLFAGPIGLLTHLTTAFITQTFFRQGKETQETTEATPISG